MAGIFERQFNELGARFGGVEQRRLPSGTILVTVPAVPLPPGWSASATSVRFLVPAGYPFAALDCFWADNGVSLAGGGQPHASQPNYPVPETGQTGLWFSWHLTGAWDPNRDTLSGWMNTINDRLRRAQ
jgi:hypothetical protein